MLKKVWERRVGFGAGGNDLSSKGLSSRLNSLNLFYRPLSGTALSGKDFFAELTGALSVALPESVGHKSGTAESAL